MLPHPPGLIAFQPALFFQMTKASKVGSTQTQMDHPWAHELARRAPSHSSQCSKRLIQSIDRNADLLTVFFLVISTGYRSVEKKRAKTTRAIFIISIVWEAAQFVLECCLTDQRTSAVWHFGTRSAHVEGSL